MQDGSDWANLLPEVLQLIAGRLIHIIDKIIFSSVCSSWRRAAGLTDPLQPHLPWLIHYTEENSIPAISFFNVSTPQNGYVLPLRKARQKSIFFTSHGWLAIIGKLGHKSSRYMFCLHKPITLAQIHFPLLPMDWNSDLIRKIVSCPHPSSPGVRQLLVAVWCIYPQRLAFIRQGERDWTVLNYTKTIDDIVYFDNELYLIDCDGRLAVLQVDSSTPRQLILPRASRSSLFSTFRLVEAGGDLLLLTFSSKVDSRKLGVFKLDKSRSGVLNWMRLGMMNITIFPESWIESICAQDLPDRRGYRIYLALSSSMVRIYSALSSSVQNHSAGVQIIDVVTGVGIIEQSYYQFPVPVPGRDSRHSKNGFGLKLLG